MEDENSAILTGSSCSQVETFASSEMSQLKSKLAEMTAARNELKEKYKQLQLVGRKYKEETTILEKRLEATEQELEQSKANEAAARDFAAQKEKELIEATNFSAGIEEQLRKELYQKDEELRELRQWASESQEVMRRQLECFPIMPNGDWNPRKRRIDSSEEHNYSAFMEATRKQYSVDRGERAKPANRCTKDQLFARIVKISADIHQEPVVEEELEQMTDEQISALMTKPIKDELNIKSALVHGEKIRLNKALYYYRMKDKEHTAVKRSSHDRAVSDRGERATPANHCSKDQLFLRIVQISTDIHQDPVTIEQLAEMTEEERSTLPLYPIKDGLNEKSTYVNNEKIRLNKALYHYAIKTEEITLFNETQAEEDFVKKEEVDDFPLFQ